MNTKDKYLTLARAAPGIPAPQEAHCHQEAMLERLWPHHTSRRGFLIGAGASIPLVGPLMRSAAQFTTSADASSVSIDVAGIPAWRIDTRWFDGKPRLTHASTENTLRVELRNAYLPGTSVRADFVMFARRQLGDWIAELRFPGMGFKADVNLPAWLLGVRPASGHMKLAAFRLRDHHELVLRDVEGEVTLTPNWTFHIAHPRSGQMALSDQTAPISGLRLELNASANTEADAARALRAWISMAPDSGLTYPVGQHRFNLSQGGAVAYVDTTADNAHALLAPASSEASLSWGDQQSIALPADDAVMRLSLTPDADDRAVFGRLRSVCWHTGTSLAVRFSTPELPEPVLLASSGPALVELGPPITAADCFTVPLPGVDAAMFVLRSKPAAICNRACKAESVEAFVQEDIALDNYELRLRRASDAFFCTLRFKGFRLHRHHGDWHLYPAADVKTCLLEVDFGSQHLLEEAVYITDWSGPQATAGDMPAPHEAVLLALLSNFNTHPQLPTELSSFESYRGKSIIELLKTLQLDANYEVLRRHRMVVGPPVFSKKVPAGTRFEAASPTHLTFAVDSSVAQCGLPLTLDTLFAWSDESSSRNQPSVTWNPILPARAMAADATTLPGETTPDYPVVRRPLSVASEITPAMKGFEHATHIEAPARLVVSPIPPYSNAQAHEIAPWQSPAHGPVATDSSREQRAELWHARLQNAKVRAVFTPDAKPAVKPQDPREISVDIFRPPAPFPNNADEPPFRASLDGNDRHQILALTGCYDYKALYRLPDVPCPPAGSNNGKYKPVPMNAELLLVSSLGASIRYEGSWAPPASRDSSGALSVRYYRHLSQLGRDLFVQVEYKGFLFPLGVPAILTKQTERRFVLEQGKVMIAGLVQRFYIRVPKFRRQYPSVHQPLEGRLWGHTSIEVDEFVTPDLIKPEDSNMLAPAEVAARLAFWPMILVNGRPSEVQFTFGESATQTRYTAPLVWLDNGVAHDEEKLAKVISFWRKECVQRLAWDVAMWSTSAAWQVDGAGNLIPPQTRHFASVSSARLPYVIGQTGKNSFIETSRILLGVATPDDSGYADANVSAESVKIDDAVMEAQDQPPFYPVRRRAQIASTQLSALTGNANQRYLIEYDSVYAAEGFAENRNPGQVFAVFAGMGARMSFGENTARAGAFASPSALITHISALRGPVGGSASDIQPLTPTQHLQVAAAKVPSSAHANELDPKAYFAAALGDAKLLGVVRLVDILELVLAATGTQVPTISRQELFELPLELLREVLPRIDATLRDNDKWFTDPEHNDVPRAAAAQLAPAWTRLRSAVASAVRTLEPATPSEGAVLAAAVEVSSAAVALGDATSALLQDPTKLLPDYLASLLRDAQALIDVLRKLNPPVELLDRIRGQLEQLLLQRLLEELAGLQAELIGRKEFALLCDAITQVQQMVAEVTQTFTSASQLLEALQQSLLTRFAAALQRLSSLAWLMAQDACQQLVSQFVWPVVERFKQLKPIDEEVLLKPVDHLHRAMENIEQIGPALPPATHAAYIDITATSRVHVVAVTEAIHARLSHIKAVQVQFRQMASFTCTQQSSEDAARLLAAAANEAFAIVQLPVTIAMRLAQLQDDLAAAATQVPTAAKSDLHAAIHETLRLAADLIHTSDIDYLEKQLDVLAQQWEDNASDVAATIQQARRAVLTAQSMLFDPVQGLLTVAPQFEVDFSGQLVIQLQNQFQSYFRAAAALDAARVLIEQSVLAISPQAMQQTLLRALRNRLQQVHKLVKQTTLAKLEALQADGKQQFYNDYASSLTLGIKRIVDSPAYPYLAAEVRLQLTEINQALSDKKDLEPLFRKLSLAFQTLGRALASGSPGRLVNLQKIIDEIIAEFGIPSRIRITYDWDTEIFAYPKGEACIFEPAGNRRLTISSVIDVSLRGGAPAVSMRATLPEFKLNLFGKTTPSNFLSITFDGLVVTASPGRDLSCKTDVLSVMPGKALGFVQRLSAIFGGRSGFFMLPSVHGIRVGYEYHKDFDVLGGLILQNIGLLIAAELPFDNSPVRFTMQLAEKLKPFLISAGIYGGGGFLALHMRADTLESLEASFEYGAMVAFSYGPASGHGKVTAGIYIRMGGRDPVIEGFFCAEGEVSIAGIIKMGASLRVVLSYKKQTGQMSGWAEYTFSFSIGFFDFDYHVRVDYARNGDSGGANDSSDRSANLSRAGDNQLLVQSFANSNGNKVERPISGANNAGRRTPDDPGRLPSLLDSWNWHRYWLAYAPLDTDHPLACLSVWKLPAADAGCVPAMLLNMNAPATAQSLSGISWYCVPWGMTEHCGKPRLRLGLRIMPTLETPKSSDVGKQALEDWPAFVGGIEALTIAVDGVPQTIPLGQLYLRKLEELGLTLADMSALWRALFPDSLTTRPLRPSGRQAAASRNKNLVMHNSATLAELSVLRCGQLHAGALGSFASDHLKKNKGVITSVGLSGASAKIACAIAALYVPPYHNRVRNFRGQRDFGPMADKALTSTSAFALQGLLHSDQKNNAFVGVASLVAGKTVEIDTPYSDTAVGHLLRTASTGTVNLNNDDQIDPIAKAAMLRKFTHQSEAPGSSAQRPETFHDRLAGLSTHPGLMKMLGLSIDALIEAAENSSHVQVDHWGFSGYAVRPGIVMQTMMERGYPGKEPADDSHAQAGFVNLSAASGNHYLLTQLDIDRTPERLLQLAIAYRNAITSGRRSNEVDSNLQGQETVGLSLIQRQPRSKPVVQVGDQVHQLYLHDLIVGYRADVQSLLPNQDRHGARTSAWNSLMARKIRSVKLRGRDITHLFAGVGNDEAILFEKVRSLSFSDGTGPLARLKDGEYFRWSGWPLGVPRPDSEGAPLETPPQEDSVPADNDAHSPLQIEYESPGGAIRQRFGMGYRVGMRLAMIDGNSISVDEAASGMYQDVKNNVSLGDETGADDFGYAPLLRFELLPPPKCLLNAKPDRVRFPLESNRHLIVADGKGIHARRKTARTLVPPRCANIELAIRHGMFDGPGIQAAPPASAFPGVQLSSQGEFPVFSHGSGEQANEDAYYQKYSTVAEPQVPYYPDPWATTLIICIYRKGDDRLMKRCFFEYYDKQQYRWPNCRALQLELHAVERVQDPVFEFDVEQTDDRLIIRALPGCHLVIRTWHEMNLEMLNQSAVVDQMVTAVVDQTGAVLRNNLQLAAGAARVDSRQAVIDTLSQWRQIRDFDSWTARPADEPSRLLNLVSVPMLNPYAEMEAIHAVTQPLSPAELSSAELAEAKQPLLGLAPVSTSSLETPFAIQRRPGESNGEFVGHVRFHRPSTRNIDALASWHENAGRAVRSPRTGRFAVAAQKRQGQLFQLRDLPPVIMNDCGEAADRPMQSELDARQMLQKLDCTLPASPAKPDNRRPVTNAYDFGDTRARVIDVTLLSRSRFSSEFGTVNDEVHTLASKAKRVVVKGTERPLAPKVEYVVPLYQWCVTQESFGRKKKSRDAGWFRLWLGSEWYSSGNGELLALVCWPPGLLDPSPRKLLLSRTRPTDEEFGNPDPSIELLVTRWGLDPLARETPQNFGNLPSSSLRNRLRNAAQILSEARTDDSSARQDYHHLQDLSSFEPVHNLDAGPGLEAREDGRKVALALYRPVCDAVSGRWYVDIQIDPLYAYCPFVRLALARYQPHALPHLRLSEIINTQFVQLLPGRVTTIIPGAEDKHGVKKFTIVLSGTSLGAIRKDRAQGSAIYVRLEHQSLREQYWYAPGKDANLSPDPWTGQAMTFDPGSSQWRQDLTVPTHPGHNYSVVIEEFECLQDQSNGASIAKRLVYFDRIMLFP